MTPPVVEEGQEGVGVSADADRATRASTEPASGLGPDGRVSTDAWPETLTPELSNILGRPCFMFISFAQTFRAAGFDIPTRAEDEQAFFLHRFLGHWFKYGDAWMDAANADIREVKLLAAKATGAA